MPGWVSPGPPTLVRDDIISEIEVRQKLAPTLALGVVPADRAALPGRPRGRRWLRPVTRARRQAVRRSTWVRSAPVRSCWGWWPGLAGPSLAGGSRAARYWPAEEQGHFSPRGNHPVSGWSGDRLPASRHAQWDMMASLRYDFHRFTTDELEARGFSRKPGSSAGRRPRSGLARGRR